MKKFVRESGVCFAYMYAIIAFILACSIPWFGYKEVMYLMLLFLEIAVLLWAGIVVLVSIRRT